MGHGPEGYCSLGRTPQQFSNRVFVNPIRMVQSDLPFRADLLETEIWLYPRIITRSCCLDWTSEILQRSIPTLTRL